MKKHAIVLVVVLLGFALVISHAQARLASQSPTVASRNSSRKSQATVDGRYPQSQGPVLNQLAALTASDGLPGNHFGGSVAIEGDTVVAGDWTWNGAGFLDLFIRPLTGWANMTQVAKLTTSDGTPLASAAISGDTVVGSGGTNCCVYVFVKPKTGWTDMTETARLVVYSSAILVAEISGDTIVGLGGDGSVYVFVKPETGWTDMTQTAQLTTSNGDFLWGGVGISGNTVVSGTVYGNSGSGAAYVFVQPPGGWANMTETAELTKSDGGADAFGNSVAISGDTIVVGAPNRTLRRRGSDGWEGAAYVFVEPESGWTSMTQTAELTASDSEPQDQLGMSVVIDGDTVVAGAPQNLTNGVAANGKAYSFSKPAGGWSNMTESDEFASYTGERCDAFGTSLAMNAGTLVAGAPGSCGDGTSSGKPGVAYVFGRGVGLSSGSLVFGTQGIGTTTFLPVVLSNNGTAALNITSIAASPSFSQSNKCPASLAVNADCTILVGFQPRAFGTFTGSVTITDDAPNNPQIIALSGVAAAAVVSPSTLNLGTQHVGTSSQPQPVTLTNYAAYAVRIAGISIGGTDPSAFSETTNCLTSVPAGGSCTISVTFTPNGKGATTATLNVGDSGGASPQTVKLSGTGR